MKRKILQDCRSNAARIIGCIINNESSLDALLASAVENVPEKDHALLQELCYGSLRYYFQLHASVEKYLNKPLKSKDADILGLLILSAYQIHFMRIPEYAAVNEAVNTCRTLGKAWAGGMTNAILRRVIKDGLSENPSIEARTNHPEWMVNLITDAWPEQAPNIFLANNQKGPMTLRINQQKVSRESYLEMLTAQGMIAEACSLSESGIQLQQAVDVNLLPGFSEGLISIQDEAAQLAAPLLMVDNNQKVLDACAAPGVKTCHLLELHPDAEITAVEINEERANRIRTNLERLQLSAEIIIKDACELSECKNGTFDRILLDVPCSATGVIRRHPDIKLLRRESDIKTLVTTQMKLLNSMWQKLAPGGILLYTTCSVLPQENEEVVASFLAKADDATVSPMSVEWGIDTGCGRQLLPKENGHDGFYFSRLVKGH